VAVVAFCLEVCGYGRGGNDGGGHAAVDSDFVEVERVGLVVVEALYEADVGELGWIESAIRGVAIDAGEGADRDADARPLFCRERRFWRDERNSRSVMTFGVVEVDAGGLFRGEAFLGIAPEGERIAGETDALVGADVQENVPVAACGGTPLDAERVGRSEVVTGVDGDFAIDDIEFAGSDFAGAAVEKVAVGEAVAEEFVMVVRDLGEE